MEHHRRWIYLVFLLSSVLVGFVGNLLAEKIVFSLETGWTLIEAKNYLRWGSFLLGLASFVFMRLNRSLIEYMEEVFVELEKVHWPQREESMKASVAVMIAVTIAGFLLWFVDLLWIWSLRLVIPI